MLLIGAKIQEYRKRQGLSQEEFSARVGVTRQAADAGGPFCASFKWQADSLTLLQKGLK